MSMSKDMLSTYGNPNLLYSVKGFTIKNKGTRVKWVNPVYEDVSALKMNYNDK